MTDEAGENIPPDDSRAAAAPQSSTTGAPPPPATPTTTSTRGRGGDRSSLAYILIGLGLLILLLNLGWFGDLFGGLFSLLRLWPVALIAVGADMVTGGKYRLIVVAAAVVVGLLLLASWQRPGAGGVRGEAQFVDVPLDGANRIDLNLETGVTELTMASAPSGATALSGEIVPTGSENVTVQSRRSGGTLDIEVVSRSERGAFGFFDFVGPRTVQGGWNLVLTEGVPVDLDIDTGVGSVDLDLSLVDLRSLELNAGVGSTTVALPRNAGFDAAIDGGVGSITLLLPEGAPVRIDVDTGIGDIDIDGSFERNGNIYTTASYRDDGAGARISIDVGIGQVRVDTVP